VIPVLPQPEPAEFETRVRQRGKAWILEKTLNPLEPLPAGTEYPKNPAFWAKQRDGYSCLEQLYEAYQETCAYTGLYISGGAKSVDHFVPKSRLVGLAFEWSNYRLACRNINSLKQDFEDVLDPFLLESNVFHLILDVGVVYVNPAFEDTSLGIKAKETIERLKLERLNKLRAEYFSAFQSQEISFSFLQKRAPFVFSEAKRQGLLSPESERNRQ
jgi:hypothetical protein